MTPDVDSSPALTETTTPHTRLVKCTLAVPESRIYWERANPSPATDLRAEGRRAFDESWFGSRSAGWVGELLAAMRVRFRAFPESLEVLHRWSSILPETRSLVCHWHVQLTDPIYRAFAGDFLPARHEAARPEVTRLNVVGWLEENGPGGWTMATRVQMASKLLSCASVAGLVTTRRDPRPVSFPRIPDEALSYALHVLRGVHYSGTLLDNPYLRSVGLFGPILEARLRTLPSLAYRRTADLTEFGWRYPSLTAWAAAELETQNGAR